MPDVKDLKDMTDEELANAIDAKFGSIENANDDDMNDPCIIELLDRASRGRT